MAPSLIGLVNTERLQGSIFAPFRLARLSIDFKAPSEVKGRREWRPLFFKEAVRTAPAWPSFFFKIKLIAQTLCR
jgi:hypothetical protein